MNNGYISPIRTAVDAADILTLWANYEAAARLVKAMAPRPAMALRGTPGPFDTFDNPSHRYAIALAIEDATKRALVEAIDAVPVSE